jgi:hypothetical protein
VIVVEQLIAELATVCTGLPDQRKGPRRDGDYTMADIALSAFSLFFMGSPSFLGHQRALERGQSRSNCQTLFGISEIPSDNYIRLMLDGVSPAAFDGLFMRAIEAAGPLTRFQRLGERVLIALDGSEYFCSRKIKCPQCSTRRRSDGGVECFHAFLGATWSHQDTRKCCLCRRSLSHRKMGLRNRIASAVRLSAGWPARSHSRASSADLSW